MARGILSVAGLSDESLLDQVVAERLRHDLVAFQAWVHAILEQG